MGSGVFTDHLSSYEASIQVSKCDSTCYFMTYVIEKSSITVFSGYYPREPQNAEITIDNGFNIYDLISLFI